MLDDKMPEENRAQKEPEPLNQPPRMAASTSPSAPSSALSEPSAQIPSAQQTTPASGTPLVEPLSMASASIGQETASAGPIFNQPQSPPAPSVKPSSMHETIDRSNMSSSTPHSNLRGFWRLFANAWHNYWPHFWTFVKLNLLTVVIMLIPFLAVMLAIPLGFSRGGGLAIVGIILGVIILAFVIIFMLRLITANIVLACRIAAGKEKIGVFNLLKIAKHNVGKIIGVAILAGLAVMAGQLLLVIPGLIFLTWFSLAAFVVVFEDLGAIKSMGRSYNLIRGYGWETFYLLAGITLITGLLGFLVNALVGTGLILGMLGIGSLYGGAGEATANINIIGSLTGFIFFLVLALIFAGLVSLLAPIWEIMPAMRYLDLKNIKDNNLPKTESTAKAAIISIILALIWAPLIAWGMWANYQELTGQKTKIQPSKDNINDILKDMPPTTEPWNREQLKIASPEVKARDARRKSDLRILKAAFDLYQRNNGVYPMAAGFPRPLSKMEGDRLTEEYIKSIPEDPSPETNKPYLYVSQAGKDFVLFAALENQNDPDIKTSGPDIDTSLPGYLPEGYNYWITSD